MHSANFIADYRKQVTIADDHRLLADEATVKAEGLGDILRSYFKLFPELWEEEMADLLKSAAENDQPRGAEAVRQILQDAPNTPYYVSELVTQLRERGWLPESDNPANAVRAALERLVGDEGSDVWKVHFANGKVAYRYDPDADPDPPSRAPTYAGGDEEPF